ncbi:MAG TPA: hypothetical protein VHA52_05065 [Candidatus Babeliaceae bacterium]|nr:hypothetical protein [Candidatus Babeliaceae bacterium]
MKENAISEIKEIKNILSKLLGTSDLDPKDQFSTEALDQAAKLFLKFRTERGEWVSESDLSKYFKDCWRAGKFIREHFNFNDYYKYGHTHFYKKKSIQRLAEELKTRKIDLKRYMEYIDSQASFKKKMAEYKDRKKGKYAYLLPDDLEDIQTSDPPKPDVEAVNADLKRLRDEFINRNLAEYIDIYRDSYAMMKSQYFFDRYLPAATKSTCRRWCDNFNYANHAYELLTKKKAKFVPVKDDDMYEL